MSGYPYDPDRLARTLDLLRSHLPAYLATAEGRGGAEPDLDTFLRILAAPLAALRQSIEELQADLFVETADDAMLPLLAEGIGLGLLFRDAEANRRDLAGAMERRRAKGTPAMLGAMARALSARLVTLREGWKLVQLTQDLNLPRPERTLPDLRRPSVAERAAGPYESLARTVDPRPVSARSGRAHPRHLAFWTYPSPMHPLLRAEPHRLRDGAADLRFAFDGDDAWRPLRLRATGAEDDLASDRVPDRLFAESPGDWFGREGRFTVNIANLPAAATPRPATRVALSLPASGRLIQSGATLEVIEFDGLRSSGPVRAELMAVPLAGSLPDIGSAVVRAGVTLDPAGPAPGSSASGSVAATLLPMLRLQPEGGASSRAFGGAVLRAGGSQAVTARPAEDPELAAEGYLLGSLYLRVPPLRVTGSRWFYIGADGALHRAAEEGAPDVTLPLGPGGALPARAVASAPVGPVWPEAPATAERRPFAPALAAPGAAPVVLHGARVLRPNGTQAVPQAARSALSFALTFSALGRQVRPMLRLSWTGPDRASLSWTALDQDGAPAPDLPARLAELAEVLAAAPADLALALRFETDQPNAFLLPGEVGFTAFDGRAVLVHLPELRADSPASAWPTPPPPFTAHSVALQVGADGSTWLAGTNRLRRRSLGPAAPLAAPGAMRRREPRHRRLCPWRSEGAQGVLDPTPPGRLDIDPAFGLFALAASEPPQEHPPREGSAEPPPAPVTTDHQTGATMPIGALPLDYDRALRRAPEPPTRLVSASGHLAPGADPALAALPLHPSLAAALAAIATAPLPLEVVELQDSFVYGETLIWPEGPGTLVLRAANGTRPLLRLAASTPGPASYARLELTGLALTAEAPLTLALPPAQAVALTHLTIRRADLALAPALAEADGTEMLTVDRSVLGPLRLADRGEIRINDSILDAGADGATHAIDAPAAALRMDRATVLGPIRAERVDISDSLMLHPVFAAERFRGCIRFSALPPDAQTPPPGGQTPRKHRVVRDARPRFVSKDRLDPAYLRLAPDTDPRLAAGAEDGGEMGAFNAARLPETLAALRTRLAEHAPAGLLAGLILQS